MNKDEYDRLILRYLANETSRDEEKRLLDFALRTLNEISRLTREVKKKIDWLDKIQK